MSDIGDDTRKYLASFINELKSKSRSKVSPIFENKTPVSKTDSMKPVLFSGSLTQEEKDKIKEEGEKLTLRISKTPKIELTEKEKKMLEIFSKLNK